MEHNASVEHGWTNVAGGQEPGATRDAFTAYPGTVYVLLLLTSNMTV